MKGFYQVTETIKRPTVSRCKCKHSYKWRYHKNRFIKADDVSFVTYYC